MGASSGMSCKRVALALLAASVLTSTQATQQYLGMMSKLRGFSQATFVQHQQEYDYTRAIDSNRRLDQTAAASEKANEVGASVRKAIKQLRGGTDKFYQDLVTAVKITMCEQNLAKNDIRFVSCDADNAYLDDNGNPVRLTVSSLTDDETVNAYDQGQCEVKPNCYWAEIMDGDTTRAKVYADADSTMDATDAKNKIKEWATGVIGFVIPGIVLGVLSLLTMVFFLMCRCCCNRCGGRYPREEGYTCMEKFLPVLFFLLFAIGVIVVSAAAFLYRGTMLSAVDDMFNATSGTLENGSEWIVNIRTPLQEIAATVVESADKVETKLAGTGFIDTGLSNITTELAAIKTDCTDVTIPTGCVVDTSSTTNPNKNNVDKNGDICLPCPVCTVISYEAGNASTQITTNAAPGVQQLSNVKAQLNTKLVEISGNVQSAVSTQVSTANDLSTTVDDTKSKVDDYDSKFQSYKNQLGYAIMALFALALVVIVIGFIGILFGLTPLKVLANIMHIAYFLGFIALILTFIISAIVLAIGVVLGDACEVTLIFANNWTVPLGDSAKAIDACFQNESLLDVFNLSSKLDFARGGIDFPDLDMTSMFNFSDLNTFATDAQNIDSTAFSFDEQGLTTLLANFNSYASQSQTQVCKPNNIYTEANLLQPWLDNTDPPAHTSSETAVQFITTFYQTNWDAVCLGGGGSSGQQFTCASQTVTCTFSEFMTEQFTALFNMATIKQDVADFVTKLHSDASAVTTSTSTFETETKQFNTDIDDIKNDLDSNLIEYVGEFEDAMYCTFIADGFWKIYDALCANLMPSITMIALMLFLCGLFLIAVNICLIIGVKRLKAHGNGHIMDSEMKFK